MIEICATDLNRLVSKDVREQLRSEQIGAGALRTHLLESQRRRTEERKDAHARAVQGKYSEQLIALAEAYGKKNLWQIFSRLSPEEQQERSASATRSACSTSTNERQLATQPLQVGGPLPAKDPKTSKPPGANWQKYCHRVSRNVSSIGNSGPESGTGRVGEELGYAWCLE